MSREPAMGGSPVQAPVGNGPGSRASNTSAVGWPVDSAGDSTVIRELGIQAVGPTPGQAAYLLSETGKPSAPRVFHTGFLF